MQIRLRFGQLSKTLNVYGNRYWKYTGGFARMTAAEPFGEMDVSWENAFGGSDFPLNPLGKGTVPVRLASGDALVPLPNIEDPKHLIGSPRDRPAPAGFGPYDFVWPQRFSKLGTYDERWKRERFPGFAADLDWSAFNAATEDQWIPGYLKGGEAIELFGMHPVKPIVLSRVPTWQPRCFINQQSSSIALREVPCHAETMWLFPHVERGVLIYRGLAKIDSDDAFDVKQLLLAVEEPGKPKSPDHYRQVLELRLDAKKGALAATRDRDLLPEPREFPPIAEEHDELAPLLTTKLLTRRNQRRKAEKELEKAKSKAVEAREKLVNECKLAGVPVPPMPDFDRLINMTLPPEPGPAKPGEVDVDAIMQQAQEAKDEADKMMAEQESVVAQQEEMLRQKCKDNNIDFDKMKKEAQDGQGARPKFSAKEEMERLQDLRETMKKEEVENAEINKALDDPALIERLEQTERQLDEMYRNYAHYFAVPKPLSMEKNLEVRAQLLAAHRGHQSLAGFDASGADLAGIDLNGADLSQAFLVGVNLQGANLAGANLSGACLAHAKCAGLKAVGIKMVDTCLGKADLQGADLSGADLTKANFTDANLSQTKMVGANFTDADLRLNAKLPGADLSKAILTKGPFLQADLTGVNLVGADLTKAIFLECSLTGADLRESKLDSVMFLKVKADGIKLNKAEGKKLLAVHETTMTQADFRDAVLPEALLRGLNLEGARFAGAIIDRSDFSQSNLRQSDLSSTSAKQARFNRTDLRGANFSSNDLFEASLQKAFVPETSLNGSNLYSADLIKLTISEKTDFRGVNLKKTLLEDGVPGRNSKPGS